MIDPILWHTDTPYDSAYEAAEAFEKATAAKVAWVDVRAGVFDLVEPNPRRCRFRPAMDIRWTWEVVVLGSEAALQLAATSLNHPSCRVAGHPVPCVSGAPIDFAR